MSLAEDIQATIDALTALQEPKRARDQAMFAELKGVVARLDQVILPIGEKESAFEQRPRRRDEPRPGQAPDDSGPFDVATEATIARNDFGPTVRAKLRAEAFRKETW